LIADAKATNYAVVRLPLIERLYELMYDQKRELGADERAWPHRILGATEIIGLDPTTSKQDDILHLRTRSLLREVEETLDVDLIIAATGYQRTHHVKMMQGLTDLLPDGKVEVGRDYGIKFEPGKVAPGSGVWLQGCNEGTHGVS
jgi:L-ornithine N5-monooxygenase